MMARMPIAAVGFAVLSAVALVLPWVRTGSRSRSSIEMIASAGALDVIEGTTKAIVVLLWFCIPLLVAAALIAFAAGRLRLLAGLILPLGPILGAIVGLLRAVGGDIVEWGAWLSAVFAVGGSISAIMVLATRQGRTAGE